MIRFDTTILGGLPVTVSGRVHPPEPDVGLPGHYFELYDITFTDGRPVPDAIWRKLQRSYDLERIYDEGLAANEPDPDVRRDAKRDDAVNAIHDTAAAFCGQRRST